MVSVISLSAERRLFCFEKVIVFGSRVGTAAMTWLNFTAL